MYKVKVDSVSKIYDLNTDKKDKLLSLFKFHKNLNERPYFALRDVSFEVQPGDSVGIIGLNGSGKSTLSNLLAEVSLPTHGSIDIKGKSSLIAISAGLNNDLTGEENIKMKCLMHGMTEEEIEEKYDDIVQFSELDDFIYQPIKSYSSGMKSRLGFAIAIHTNPDVLIVDEALSVGDETFSNKCIDKMREFQKQGKTIFFVSHSAAQIKQMCNKAAWLHFGELKEYGNCQTVIKNYQNQIQEYRNMTKDEQQEYKRVNIAKQQESGKKAFKEKETFEWNNIITFVGLSIAFIGAVCLQIFS